MHAEVRPARMLAFGYCMIQGESASPIGRPYRPYLDRSSGVMVLFRGALGV